MSVPLWQGCPEWACRSAQSGPDGGPIIANDDPSPFLRQHGWHQDQAGAWGVVRPDDVL